MRWVIIVSPVSGKRTGERIVRDELLPALQAAKVSAEVLRTERAGHAVDLAARHGSRECGVVAVGGDGTINEVLTGLATSGKLDETPVGVLSLGTMNFYGYCAALPATPKELAQLIARGETRRSPLMHVVSGASKTPLLSFEAVHIGPMAHRVCRGAQEWRMSLGPMFGIFLNLILGNLFPKANKHRGTLRVYPPDGGPALVKTDDFFWIIVTHRNPYNGAVSSNDMWVSYMTLDAFPGFGRMMEFFEPEMEHFQGTSRCFGAHHRALRVDFALEASDPSPAAALVLDGDATPSGRTVSVSNVPGALSVVASATFPTRVAEAKVRTPKTLTPASERWLAVNPPPEGVVFYPPKAPPRPAHNGRLVALSLVLVAAYLYYRRRRGG